MAKKLEMTPAKLTELKCCGCSWKEVLFFAGAVVCMALAAALFIEGLIAQWNLGFRYGFVVYLLAFLFLGLGKYCKMKSCMGLCMPCKP
jgi:hypothetical protein